MDNLESKILLPSLHACLIRFWRRYVDDVICVWNETDTQALALLRWLNEFDHNMTFTLENAGANEIT